VCSSDLDGIINPDAPVLDAGPSVYMFGVGQGWPSAWATGGNGVEKVVTYKLTESVYSTDSIQGSMNVINANSKYKEESLKLLELANTDRKFRDMLGWGLEGTDFEYATPTTIRRLNDRWIAWQGYMQAQFFNKSTEVGSYTWDEVRQLNESAVKSPLLGFVSDTTSFLNELAQIQTIQEKYWNDLSNGSANTDVIIPQFIAEMKAAGLDKIMTEVQRQIDAFLRTR
jgi:putative aldouronate transport system substrate-binding protein